MIRSFEGLMEAVRCKPRKTIAVAAAQDEDVLLSLAHASAKDMIQAILVGDGKEIDRLWRQVRGEECPFRIIDEKDKSKAAELAVSLVREGKAHLIMKGILGTAEILKAVLHKERGLRKSELLSHVTVFEAPEKDRLMLMTDAAMNVAPDLQQKAGLIQNASMVAGQLGIQRPKVAVIAAVELVNPAMPATVDAAVLSQMAARGQIRGVEIDGPLALDNAVSPLSAQHKGIGGPVAGQADILLMPDIEAGNVLYKSLTYFSERALAGVVVGAAVPVILTSRADSPNTKLNSIALGCFMERE